MRMKALPMLVLSILLLAVFASGQARTLAKAKVPFAFSVAGKAFPAGDYTFTTTPATGTITVRGSGEASVAPVITRLAGGIHTTPTDSHVVFDRAGDSYVLSEIWVPGEDGYLLHATKGEHEHRVLDTPK